MLIHRLRSEFRELPRLALALATLAIVGFSLVLCAQLSVMQLAPRSSYTLSNSLGAPGRNLLLLTLAAGIVTPAAAGLILYLRRGPRAIETLERWATVLSPLSIAFALPAFFLVQVAETKPLFYLVMLSAFGLALRELVAASLRAFGSGAGPKPVSRARLLLARLPPLRLPRALALALVLACAAAYALFLGRYAIAHHRLIQTLDTDVGIVDNLMSNLSHGRWFRVPAQFGTLPGNYLTARPEYIAWLFVPIYRLHPSAETLLWLQVSLIALCVLPLFLLTARWLGQKMAIWVSLAFLSLAPLQYALLNGFSWLPAFCLFSFLLYYAVFSERAWLIALCLPATLASTEAGPVGVFALGVFIAASCKKTRLGVTFCVLGTLVFAVNTRLALYGAGTTQVVPPFASGLKTLLTNPVYFVLDLARAVKLSAMLHVLAPLVLLPLSALNLLVLVMPGLLFTSATHEFWPASITAAQYCMVWIPGCLLALLFALQRLQRTSSQRPLFLGSVVALSCVLASHSYDFGVIVRPDALRTSAIASVFQSTPEGEQRYGELMSVARLIPATASVVASPYMLSHVSNRVDVFNTQRPYAEADYVLFSARELVDVTRSSLATTFSKHRYALVRHAGEFYLFRRAAETPATIEALRTLDLLPAERPAENHR